MRRQFRRLGKLRKYRLCGFRVIDGFRGSKEKIEISISTWGASDEVAVFKEVLKGFEAANPNVKVKLLHIPNDYSTKMNTMISGGTAPDVLFVSDGDFPRWVKQGAFLNINDRVTGSEKSNWMICGKLG